ncbi:hypothetical protein RhiXN_08286 [Rhizoctonia solani]|uniref:C2H2-type domain-containing protein n=1 Tax=Rhizoctonia solani TaxID=456999 RepID=A0A8H8P2L3_9AGAM|nr:uncharacterized protein RhiXN_08286 [Rhizoctonia solani]QRW23250.1 hypothetical protein RhiXN_08286 [Rhizoctonia solani]
MARGGTMYARAIRRAAARASHLEEANGTEPSDVSRVTCPYCGSEFGSEGDRNRHVSLYALCHARHECAVKGKVGQKRKREYEVDSPATDVMDRPAPAKHARIDETALPIAGLSRHPNALPYPGPDHTPDSNSDPVLAGGAVNGYTKDGVFVERFPVRTAGMAMSTRQTGKEDLRTYLDACGKLGDRDLFETAEVMMTTGLTGRGRTRQLKAPAYREWRRKGKEVWGTSDALVRDVDQLPKGPDWMEVNVPGGKGRYRRPHTLYMRDVLEVTRELIGARRFRRCMRYAPERHWTSKSRKCRVYDEMWSGDWWWQVQNKNGTVVPLIIASDETTLTNNPRGDKAHPIYLSIGNISKAVRRKPTKRSMIIIGYLPVDSFDDVPDDSSRQQYRADLLHRSLDEIFKPLKKVSSEGVLAWCADGCLRHIYPLIAAWVADYPEQNDIACTTQNGCPKCMQRWHGRGCGGPTAPLRNQEEARQALRGYRLTEDVGMLQRLGLKPVAPFWDGFPELDVGRALVPDLLHQLYKGMFEHIRDWVEDLLGTVEFNRRFVVMPAAQGLRHFNKGVTRVKIWAGRESRDMMRQFLPIIVDAKAPPDFVRLVRALLDFSYLAHGAQLTEVELSRMDEALAAFHKYKDVLVNKKDKRLGIVVGDGGFDRIPKLHVLGHYTNDIRELGTPDGYSTETPEHLHILYVKIPWRMSNRRNPLPQMVQYVRRLEALEIQRVYLEEYYGGPVGIQDIREFDFDDDEDGQDTGQAEGEDGSEDEEDPYDSEDELEDGVEIPTDRSEVPAASEIYYPRPMTSIARRPTVPNVAARVIASSYGAPEFIRSLQRFLSATTSPSEPPLLVPSHRFPVWHKAVLGHYPLPFAPSQPCPRDVIRAHPPTRDAAGRVSKAGVFDTVLFAADRSCSGLKRFRAGRVRVIFALPQDFAHLYDGPLVYLDVFESFTTNNSSGHSLFSTTPMYYGASYASLVLPLGCLKLACHLAPDFSSPFTRPPVSSCLALTNTRHLLNEFYNYFTFLLLSYWRVVGSGRTGGSSTASL